MAGTQEEGNALAESYGHEVFMTVKNGKILLLWWAYNISVEEEWVALYRSASDSDDQYIKGAWQWTDRGYTYQTDVDMAPGLQARYIRGKNASKGYKCMAKTDPFPAINEAVQIYYGDVSGREKAKCMEETAVDETLYDKTPEELAAVLRQDNSGVQKDEDMYISGTAMLSYKNGCYLIDWKMEQYEPHDWIGLYDSSSTGINDYITYQYVKRKAPYETGIRVNYDAQIRYIRWSQTQKKYVEVVRSGGFKQIKVGSNTNVFPYWPNDRLFKLIQSSFPKLTRKNVKITGKRDLDYNCIAWSLGFNDRWINPAVDLEQFVKDYLQAGCRITTAGSGDTGICTWAAQEKPTHGSRRYEGKETASSTLWESKLGQNYRITHGCDELAGYEYGEIVNYFSVPKKFMAQQQETVLTAKTYETLGRLIDRTDPDRKEAFEKLFTELWEGWTSAEFQYESDTRSIRRLPAFDKLMQLGQTILPLLAAKLIDERYFFALPLYDALQPADELKISYKDKRHEMYFLEGEQQRAIRTVAAFCESFI